MCEISLFFFCQRQPLLPILLCNVTQRRFNPPHALLAQGLLHEDLHIYAVDYMKRSCCVLSLIHVWVSSGLQCVCVCTSMCVSVSSAGCQKVSRAVISCLQMTIIDLWPQQAVKGSPLSLACSIYPCTPFMPLSSRLKPQKKLISGMWRQQWQCFTCNSGTKQHRVLQ